MHQLSVYYPWFLSIASGYYEEHQKIADYLDECKFDRVLLAGEEFGKVIPSFEHFQDVVALKESLERYKPKGYYILIKGSNSMKLGQLQEIL